MPVGGRSIYFKFSPQNLKHRQLNGKAFAFGAKYYWFESNMMFISFLILYPIPPSLTGWEGWDRKSVSGSVAAVLYPCLLSYTYEAATGCRDTVQGEMCIFYKRDRAYKHPNMIIYHSCISYPLPAFLSSLPFPSLVTHPTYPCPATQHPTLPQPYGLGWDRQDNMVGEGWQRSWQQQDRVTWQQKSTR